MTDNLHSPLVEGCFSCEMTAKGMSLPIRERLYDDEWWRVAHSFHSALRGWLVVIPRRHVATIAELTPDEAVALGPLLQRLSSALQFVTGCFKTYVVMFAEADGFHHVHFHVIPRMVDMPADRVGTRVFDYLRQPATEWIPAAEMDQLAQLVAEQLAQQS